MFMHQQGTTQLLTTQMPVPFFSQHSAAHGTPSRATLLVESLDRSGSETDGYRRVHFTKDEFNKLQKCQYCVSISKSQSEPGSMVQS